MRIARLVIAVLSLVSFSTIIGCSQKPAPTETGQTVESGESGSPSEHKHEHGEPMSEDIQANLAKLSDSDRAAVEKQHHCPVSGEQLGSMGAPIKVEVEGHQVWLCCESCRESLLAEPEKYISKLP